MDHYMKKTFYKTASLMANSCKAVAILGGGSRDTAATAWEYGRNLGLAFQVLSQTLPQHAVWMLTGSLTLSRRDGQVPDGLGVCNAFFMSCRVLPQFVDDILDFTGSSSLLGKPALNDLASGITTAPVRCSPTCMPRLSAEVTLPRRYSAMQQNNTTTAQDC